MTKDFYDLDDAGKQLADILVDAPVAVIALIGQGAEIACQIATKFSVPVIPALLHRDTESNEIIDIEITDCAFTGMMYVADDAIETGHTTRKAARYLAQKGYTNLRFVTPLCPRTTAADLLPLIGEVIAVQRPLIHRSLAWHYEIPPNSSPATALALIERFNANRP